MPEPMRKSMETIKFSSSKDKDAPAGGFLGLFTSVPCNDDIITPPIVPSFKIFKNVISDYVFDTTFTSNTSHTSRISPHSPSSLSNISCPIGVQQLPHFLKL